MNHADVDIQGFGLPNQNDSATKWTSIQTHALLILTKSKKKLADTRRFWYLLYSPTKIDFMKKTINLGVITTDTYSNENCLVVLTSLVWNDLMWTIFSSLINNSCLSLHKGYSYGGQLISINITRIFVLKYETVPDWWDVLRKN